MNLTTKLELQLLWTAVILVVPWVVRAVVMRFVHSRNEDPRLRYRWRKATQYLVVFAVIAALARIWIDNLHEFNTLLGLAAAGVAVSLTQPLTNIAGWMLIMLRRPFDVGDRVQIGATRGDVIDVGVFQFALMEVGEWVAAEQSTGRIVHVPNARVFNEPLANYSHDFPFIWLELPVLVTFESDWREAKRLLSDIATEVSADIPELAAAEMGRASQRYMLRLGQLTPIVYTSVRESGVRLTLRMLAPPHQRRVLEEQVWEMVLEAFAKAESIDFAYPTQRFFDNTSERMLARSPK